MKPIPYLIVAITSKIEASRLPLVPHRPLHEASLGPLITHKNSSKRSKRNAR